MTENRFRILLVEDNPGDAFLVKTLLEETGEQFGIEHRSDLASAMALLNDPSPDGQFDVVLLDLTLPDSSGVETIRRIRGCAHSAPVVVLTGHKDEELAFEALQHGAEDYLTKEFPDGRTIRRSIRYAIERSRAEQALKESEERYRTIISNTSEGYWRIDPGTLDTLEVSPWPTAMVLNPDERGLYLLWHFGSAIDIVDGSFTLGWPRLSDSALFLFQEEYRLPLLPPELAALAAAGAEHLFPILLLIGLATRLSALALLVMTLTIQIFVYPSAYPVHGVWAVALLFLMAHGPGWLSIDHWIARRNR